VPDPPLTLDPAEPEPVPIEPLPPDTEGELEPLLVVPDEDGEVLLAPPELDPVLVPLMDPLDVPEPDPDMLGDADGDWLSDTPATCIACWLQRSKSARLIAPPAVAVAGRNRATETNAILRLFIGDLLGACPGNHADL